MEEGAHNTGELYIEQSDLLGLYDFSIDVESMQVTANEEKKQTRQQAVQMLSTNPNVSQMLDGRRYQAPNLKSFLLYGWKILDFLMLIDSLKLLNKTQAMGAVAGQTACWGKPPAVTGSLVSLRI